MTVPILTKTLFISDLHLCVDRPTITALFLRFLEQEVTKCAALYILGDLFEVWLGDDDTGPENSPILAGLRKLVIHGVAVHIMHGNRDFLIGSGFEANTGCRLLPEPTIIDLYGQPTLLMHGDTLCTQDIAYQKIRSQVRDPAWQQALLSLPLAKRAELARQYRMESAEQTRHKPEAIMDVDQSAVEQVMREHQVTQLIHGHTHRPAIHEFLLDGQAARRIVLGDWYEQGSALWCASDGCRFSRLPP